MPSQLSLPCSNRSDVLRVVTGRDRHLMVEYQKSVTTPAGYHARW